MRGFHIPIWRKMTAKIKKVKMPDLSLQVKIMLYIAALACAVLSIVSITCGGIFPPAAEYAVYTAAGVTLFLSCFYLAGDLDLLKQKIMELARSNTLTARLTDDIEYRSVLFAVCGVCMNIVFALFNGIAGWMSRSAWFGTLSAYYLILGMMRAYWIFHNQDKVRNRENQRSSRAPERNIWRCYGVLFLFLAVVLCGAGSLYVNPEHTACVADGPDFPDGFKPLASAMAKALSELRERRDVRWTYISPAGDFQAEGERTGKYILGGEELTLNSRGESIISYADYAIAMVDEAVNGNNIQKRISVVRE